MPSTQPPEPRRNFLSMLLGGTLATVMAPVLYVIARYLIPPQTLPSTAIVGPESTIPDGSAHAIKVGVTDAMVMRDSGGAVYALDLRCTHAGCNVAWRPAEGEFYCPCHGGVFDKEGNVLKGPPVRPLERLPVKIEGGIVRVSNG